MTALDADGNESRPSDPARAVVYALRLDPPSWPVVAPHRVAVTGDGSLVGTTVKVQAGAATVADVPGTGGAFGVDVPLAPEGNVFHARGEDPAGNRSLPSNEIVVISNTPPGAVTGLTTSVDASDVTVQWSPVPDADLFGYVVHRDGEPLTPAVPQDQAASVDASVDPGSAALAFDQNPATAWPAAPAAGQWRIVFPESVLVERLHLRFAPAAGLITGPPSSYTVFAHWQGRDLPIVTVSDNASLIVEHALPAPFATQSILVALEAPGRLAEVEVHRLGVTPAGTESVLDEAVADGRHTYTVAAMDRYGSLGPAASAETDVGDVDPPSPPTGLDATPDGRDVVLSWDPSPEPDVEGYTVLRDGVRIGSSPSADYRDGDLPNGTYIYTVLAVDTAGNESDESLPDDATVDVAPAPPSPPVILVPTDAAHPITRSWSSTDVAGRADPGSVVSLEIDGEPRGAATAGPGFEPVTPALLPSSSARALSPDGTRVAFVQGTGVSLRPEHAHRVRRPLRRRGRPAVPGTPVLPGWREPGLHPEPLRLRPGLSARGRPPAPDRSVGGAPGRGLSSGLRVVAGRIPARRVAPRERGTSLHVVDALTLDRTRDSDQLRDGPSPPLVAGRDAPRLRPVLVAHRGRASTPGPGLRPRDRPRPPGLVRCASELVRGRAPGLDHRRPGAATRPCPRHGDRGRRRAALALRPPTPRTRASHRRGSG